MERKYDVAIVGGGAAGLACAMYCGRLNLKTALFAESPGGALVLIDFIENYPGFRKIAGKDLADALEQHAREYSPDFFYEKVTSVSKAGNRFSVRTAKKAIESRTVVFATGTKRRKLGVPGEDGFSGKGVHACALCDGPLFKGKQVAVVGGSDGAAKEALLLTQWAGKVFLVYRGDELRAEPVNAKRVEENGGITLVPKTSVTAVSGGKFVKKISLDKEFKGKAELAVSAVFIEIGYEPLSGLAKPLGVETNGKGEIMIDKNSRTNVPGVFAAGDVTNAQFKQAIISAAEGVAAAYSAYRHVKEREVSPGSDE